MKVRSNDAKTLSPVQEKVRERFGIKRVVLVGIIGVLTSAPIEEDLKKIEGLALITALRAPQIRELVEHSCYTIAAVQSQAI